MSQRFRKPSHHSSKLVVHIRQRRLLPPNLHIHFPIHHRSQSTLPYVPVLWVLTAREDFMDIQLDGFIGPATWDNFKITVATTAALDRQRITYLLRRVDATAQD